MSSFINHFPYSDAHELNLDWVINSVKTLSNHVDALQEEMDQIEVMTKEEIEAMIELAINTEVYPKLVELKNQLTLEYQAYVQARISDLTAYVDNINIELRLYIDNQDAYYNALSQNYADHALSESKAYTDDKVLNVTMMINPITGEYDDVRNVVTDIINYFHSENSLTAAEYDALDLTAQAYDAYQLSAFDYDFNGKLLLT